MTETPGGWWGYRHFDVIETAYRVVLEPTEIAEGDVVGVAPQRAVLEYVAHRAGRDRECWAGVETIAATTGHSVRSVQRALAVRERDGRIVRRRAYGEGGRRMADRIRLGSPGLVEPSGRHGRKGGANPSGRHAESAAVTPVRSGRHGPPEPELEPEPEPEGDEVERPNTSNIPTEVVTLVARIGRGGDEP